MRRAARNVMPGTDGTAVVADPAAAGQPAAGEPHESGSIFRNREFRFVFTAAAASKLGIQVSLLAVPLLAVVVLNATPGEVGLLGTLATAPYLVIGLPAGAWVDRVRRKPVQIAADLARTVLLGSLPVAAALHILTLWQLYVVVTLNGAATVFFDVASQSYLPFIVGRPGLVSANAKLASVDAINQVAGRGLGGFLVDAVSAPLAIGTNAATFLWSAIWLMRVRRPEPKPQPRPDSHLLREMREGLGFVLRHPILRPIAIAGTLTNLSVQISVVMLPVIFVRELHLSAGVLGLFLTSAGIGVFLGTTAARRVGERLGNGRSMWLIGLVSFPVKFAMPFIDRGPMLLLAAAAWLLTTFQVGINNVLQVSFRQRVTPDHLLGRMNATMRFLFTGALAIGSGVAGLVGQYVGLRAVLWVGAIGLAIVWLPVFFSALRPMRDLPD